jgi:hypothetical protein
MKEPAYVKLMRKLRSKPLPAEGDILASVADLLCMHGGKLKFGKKHKRPRRGKTLESGNSARLTGR